MSQERFVDDDDDAVVVTVAGWGGRMMVHFEGTVYAHAAREAAQWVLDNVPAEDKPVCRECGARR